MGDAQYGEISPGELMLERVGISLEDSLLAQFDRLIKRAATPTAPKPSAI